MKGSKVMVKFDKEGGRWKEVRLAEIISQSLIDF